MAALLSDHLRRLRLAVPSASTDVEPIESTVPDHGSFPLSSSFLPGRLPARRHVRDVNDRIGLRVRLRPRADPLVQHIVEVVTLPRWYACQVSMRQEPHSVLPISRRTPHRLSAWAGVSWPKDDDHERNAAGVSGHGPARRTANAAAAPRTHRFAPSYARWRDRRRASASRPN
jgi:hypothetical protein